MKNRIFRSFSGLVLSILAVLSLAAPAFAADSGETGRVVRLGYFPVQGLLDGAEDGAVKSGYAFEYMQELACQAGWKYEYVYGSFPDLYQMLLSGEIDMLPYITKTPERERRLLFPDLDMGSERFYLASMTPGRLSEELQELQGRKIGTVQSAFQNALLAGLLVEKGIDCSITYFSRQEDIWQALAGGRIDYSVESSTIFQSVNLNAVFQFGAEYPYYLALADGRTGLLEEMNAARERLDESNPGLLYDLESKYFSNLPLFTYLPDESMEWLEQHGKIRVGIYSRTSPYVFYDDSGSPDGILPAYFSLMLERIGAEVPVEYVYYDGIDAAIGGLLADEIDCINPFYRSYNDAENKGLIISGTVYEAPMSVLYQGDFAPDTMDLIATSTASVSAGYVRDYYPNAAIVDCLSPFECIDKVLSGEANSVVLHADTLETLLSDNRQNLKVKSLSVNCEVCFAALPADAPLISAINKMIPYVTAVDMNEIESSYSVAINTGSDTDLRGFMESHPEFLLTALSLVLAVITFMLLLKRHSDMEYRRQLEEAKLKAEEASRAKTSFLFNMSHDIRTPMNAILGFTDMARKNIGNPEKLEDCLDKTRQAGSLLLSLINSVLEMSRIEAGRAELNESPADINYSFRNIDTTMDELAKAKNIDLRYEIGNITNPYIYTDIDRINRLIINLISNAIKYTGEGGRIRVRCDQVSPAQNGVAKYRYIVEDNGIGMSEEFQQHLFDEFSREKNTTASGVQGSGLGLSVAKAFAELMGGTIECRSRQGEGTTFTVTLPFRLQTDEERTQYYDSDTRQTMDVKHHDEPGEMTLRGKRVLLVEDNELNREIACDILSEEGIIVEEAENGAEAVKALEEKGPDYYDFILMDIQMPVMDGYEATRAIRTMYPDAKLPIIAVSANAFAEDRAASLEAGMNDHLAKPINSAGLLRILQKHLR